MLVCTDKPSKCKKRCGKKQLLNNSIEYRNHLMDECAKTVVSCGMCKAVLLRNEFESHDCSKLLFKELQEISEMMDNVKKAGVEKLQSHHQRSDT